MGVTVGVGVFVGRGVRVAVGVGGRVGVAVGAAISPAGEPHEEIRNTKTRMNRVNLFRMG